MSQASYQSSPQTVNSVSRVVRIGAQEISEDALHRVEDQSQGLLRLAFDKPTGNLTITYDATKLVFSDVLNQLARMGIKPLDSWWFRQRAAWYDFTDRNAAEQAHAKPKSCCNKIPGA